MKTFQDENIGEISKTEFYTGKNKKVKVKMIVVGCIFTIGLIPFIIVFIKIIKQILLKLQSSSTDNKMVQISNIQENRQILINDFRVKFEKLKSNEFKQIIAEHEILISKTKYILNKANERLNTKNAFVDYVTYDKYRVKLNSVKIDKDILNASYIPFVNDDTKMEYIVSLNPILDNLHDFWEMIWNENINFIILLTKMISNKKFDCIQYWPSNIGQIYYYGNNNQYRVSIVEEIDQNGFRERTFALNYKTIDKNNFRIIKQLQIFLSIDFSLKNLECFEKQIYRVHQITNNEILPPYLIHCSLSYIKIVGSLICIDRIIRQVMNGYQHIDVFYTCYQLRLCRNYIIESQNEYKFIYTFIDYFLEKYSDNCDMTRSDQHQIKNVNY